MTNGVDGKALVQSKQFWLMVMAIIVDVVASPAVLNIVPTGASIAVAVGAILSIIIRYVTDMPVTGILSAK